MSEIKYTAAFGGWRWGLEEPGGSDGKTVDVWSWSRPYSTQKDAEMAALAAVALEAKLRGEARRQAEEVREAGFEECERMVTDMLLEAAKRNQDTRLTRRPKTAADGEGVRENEIRIPAIRAQALREAAMAVRMGQARRLKKSTMPEEEAEQ